MMVCIESMGRDLRTVALVPVRIEGGMCVVVLVFVADGWGAEGGGGE